ncbi:MAG: hypothetical protein ACI4NG_05300, partial [Candidatus Gallimonas sp.]
MTRKERRALKKQISEREGGEKVRYERRSFLGTALAISLSFLLGAIAAIGGLLGGGYYAASRLSVNDLLSVLGKDPSAYVNPDYADKSLLALGREIASTEFVNFNSVAKFSPLVRTKVENISDILSDAGFRINIDSFMDTEFSALGTFMQDSMLDSDLGAVLKVNPETSSATFLSLCYGKEGEDYTVETDPETGEKKIVMNEGKTATTVRRFVDDPNSVIDDVEVNVLFNVTADSENSAMLYLAYGSREVDYTVETDSVTGEKKIVMLGDSQPKTLGDITDGDAALLEDARIRDLTEIVTDAEAEADPTKKASAMLLQAIADFRVSELKQQSRIERLKIKQVIEKNDDPDSRSLLREAIDDWRICDIADQNKINSLTIGSVIEIDENSPLFLQSLKNTSLGKLSDAVDTLTIDKVIPAADVEGNKVLRKLQNSTLSTLSDDIKALTVQDVFADEIYGYKKSDNSDYTGVVTTRWYLGGTEVAPAYFTRSGSDYTLLDAAEHTVLYDAQIAKANRAEGAEWKTPYYFEQKITVYEAFSYHVVDFDNGAALSDTAVAFDGTDEIGSFYLKTVAEGESVKMYFQVDYAGNEFAQSSDKKYRDDLERVYRYYATEADRDASVNELNSTDPEAADYLEILSEKSGETVRYYYTERVEVYAGYSDAGSYVASAEAHYFGESNEELTRNLKGSWYFLLTDPVSGSEMQVKLLEIDTLVTNMSTNVNHASLLELHEHGILENMPDKAFDGDSFGYPGVTNINQLTISQMIDLI